MTQMVRKQIYIPKRQQLLLKRKAKAVGVSEAELIRQAIDHNLEGGGQRSFRRDPEAWDKAYKFMLCVSGAWRNGATLSLETRGCLRGTNAAL